MSRALAEGLQQLAAALDRARLDADRHLEQGFVLGLARVTRQGRRLVRPPRSIRLYEFITPKDFGDNALGGSLVDKAILRRALKQNTDGELQALLDRFPVYRARCELQCRKAKEIYFSSEELFEENESQVEAGFVRILKGDSQGGTLIFEPMVNGPIMRDIIAEALPELGAKSWSQAFRIARGLSRLGRWERRSEGFKAAMTSSVARARSRRQSSKGLRR